MNKRRLTTACVLLSTLPLAAASGQDYSVDFTAGSAGNLETVVGNIELVSGTSGTITPSEILSWSLSSIAGDPVAFSVSSASGGTVNCNPMTCSIVAQGGKLILTTSLAHYTNTQFFYTGTIGPVNITGPAPGGPECISCLNIAPPAGPSGEVGSFSMVPGQVIATTAPEPGKFSLLGLALAGLAITRKRL
jgi:hypothetical protein